MKAVVTICSRRKDANPEPLPASARYLGDHVQAAASKAAGENIPFFILSGKFGLVAAEDLVPNYDYYLEREDGDLTALVKGQIKKAGITEIDFYYEEKEAWKPYIATMAKAAAGAHVALATRAL